MNQRYVDTEHDTIDGLLLIAETALAAEGFRPLNETLTQICDYVKGALGCAHVIIRVRQGEQLVIGGKNTGSSAVREDQGLGDETFSQQLVGRRNPSVEVFSTGQPRYLRTEDYASGSSARDRLAAMGVAAMYFAPITRDSSVVGVLNCYWADVHEVTAEEAKTVHVMARLAAISLATAIIAEGGEQLRRGLEGIYQQLQKDNSQLQTIHLAQSKMIDLLADQSALTIEQTAVLLASSLKRSVLVVGAAGEELASSAPPAQLPVLRAAAAAIAGTRGDAHRGGAGAAEGEYSIISIDGGVGGRTGAIVLSPGIGVEEEYNRVIARQAALVIGAHIQARSANTAMSSHAFPLSLLAMSRGLLGASQLKEMRALLQLATDTKFTLASIRTPTPEAAFRLSRRHRGFHAAGWPLITAVADGRHTLALLRGEPLPQRVAETLLEHQQEAVCGRELRIR